MGASVKDGLVVGASVASLGDSDGSGVGAKEDAQDSQQKRNVSPSEAGQHKASAGKPSALHTGWIAQLESPVGESVGDREGYADGRRLGLALGAFVGARVVHAP